MSPKFALAILLLSCVLLGIANAQQRRQYRQPQQTVRYNAPKYATRNTDGNLPPPEISLPPADGGALNPDCMPNQLASGNIDNKKPRSRH
ncbi:uncharacterized protein LOC121530235 [Drosophila eugracilis]|uniref:uncharacterized protein LOC121530235 n=1 Tax=Drosophila eugracilis TaxID=29029 RepID=UPI0007E767BC|nr:uncharacterized protein LOC121530235 [Drosophila eugracilis]